MNDVQPSTVAEMLLGAVAVAVLVALVWIGPLSAWRGQRLMDGRSRPRSAAPDPGSFVTGPTWTIDATPNTPDGRWIDLARPAHVELTVYWGRGNAPTIHLFNHRGDWSNPDVELTGRGEPVLLGLGAGSTGLVLRPSKAMPIRVELRVPPDAGFALQPGSLFERS